MCKNLMLFLLVIHFNCSFSQTPEAFKYQSVVRNNLGLPLINQAVNFRITVLKGGISGLEVYGETHLTSTNEFGLVSLEIGVGTPVAGQFSNINWADGPYFLKTELDINAGNNFQEMGTIQLLSVPFALHAKTAESLTTNIIETDPIFSQSPSSGILNSNITNWNSAYSWGNHATAGYLTSETDGSITNELQSLSIIGNNLSISNGNTIALPTTSITETDPIWNTASLNYYTKLNMQTSGASQLHFNNLINKPTTLMCYGIADAINTSHPANGITSTNITNWNSAYNWGNHATAGYLTTEADGSITNELQTLSIVGNSLSISNGNTITLPTGSSDTWTINGNNIYNSNSGFVGIGTITPTATLNIASLTSIALRLQPVGGGSSTTSLPSVLDFWSTFDNLSTDQAPRRTASIRAKFAGGAWGNETLIFGVGNNGASNDAATGVIERMRITGTGQVGIGTTAPLAKLHVEETGLNVPSFAVGNSVKWLFTCNNLGAGVVNPLIQNSDIGLIVGNGAPENSNLFIGPWSANPTGIRLTDTSITFGGKLIHSFGGIHPDNIPFQDQVAYEIGTAGKYTNNLGTGWGNNFHFASWVQSQGTKPSVAVFGEGEGIGSGSKVWGGNFVAYANYNSGTQGANSATAIGVEINFGSIQAGGIAHGLVLASAGYHKTQNYIQVQSNTTEAIPDNGIVFGGWGRRPVNGSLISTAGPFLSIPIGIDFSAATFGQYAFISTNFNVSGSGWVTALGVTQTSDIRTKENIFPIKNSLKKVLQIQGVEFNFKDDVVGINAFLKNKQIGFIAQELEKILPEVVMTDSNGKKSVAYQNMVALIIEAIKEQQLLIEKQQKEIENLKKTSH